MVPRTSSFTGGSSQRSRRPLAQMPARGAKRAGGAYCHVPCTSKSSEQGLMQQSKLAHPTAVGQYNRCKHTPLRARGRRGTIRNTSPRTGTAASLRRTAVRSGMILWRNIGRRELGSGDHPVYPKHAVAPYPTTPFAYVTDPLTSSPPLDTRARVGDCHATREGRAASERSQRTGRFRWQRYHRRTPIDLAP